MQETIVLLQRWSPWVMSAGFLFFFSLERCFPLRKPNFRLGFRLLTNVAITALVFLAGGLLVKPIVMRLMEWNAQRTFGLLYALPVSSEMRFLLGFLLLDWTYYYWHRANHTFRFLWRFHNVHHLDPDLDVSTAFRFHLGEVFWSIGFRIIQIGLLGVSLSTYLVYEVVFQLGTMFHHSNWKLPVAVERILNWFIVTPRMHAIHHSAVKEEMDSNYSVVFRWWDWLHGTLCLNVAAAELEIGVPGYHSERDNALPDVLIVPFQKQKEYWRRPTGEAVIRVPSARSVTPQRMQD